MRLEIDNVCLQFGNSVSHDESAPISVAVKSGHKVLIRGPSGCGKSTLLKAICGINKVRRGQIRYNGLSSCRVSYCPQFPTLFPVDMVSNLLCGRIDESVQSKASQLAHDFGMTELCDSLNLSRISDFRMQPSLNLSGGQVQRIGIIRALIDATADLLVFDEPTSALDSFNEAVFLGHIEQESRTTILVSHSKKFEAVVDQVYDF